MKRVKEWPTGQYTDRESKYKQLTDGSIWKVDPKELGADSPRTLQNRLYNASFRNRYPGKFRTKQFGKFLYVQWLEGADDTED